MAKKEVYQDTNTVVVNLASHKMPEIKEVRGKRWVMFGTDNLYPQYLIDLFNRSSKHNAIVTSKSTMVFGKGVSVPDEKIKDYARYINHPNAYEDLNAVTKKLINDYELHGGYAVQVIWGKGSNKISQVAYIDIAKLRVSDCGNFYFYSNDWKKIAPDKEKGFETYNKFNPFEKKGTAVYVKMKHRAGLEQYQLPDYLGAIAAIESDIEVSNWHLNNIKNGFSAGTIINFSNGIPQGDKQPAIVTQLKRKSTGTDKAGEVLVNFSDGKDRGVEVVSLQPNNLDKQFLELREHIDREIFVGHKIVSPTIFGIATAGALGQRNEMLDAYEIFTNIYINPIKKEVEADLNMFANLMGISGNDITLLRLDPVKYQLSEQTLTQVLTKDELRKLAGYEPIVVQPTPIQMSSEVIGYVDKEVLALIAKQPLIQESDISKLMGLSVDETRNILRRLNTSLLLTEQHTATGDYAVIRTLTPAGLVVVANLEDDKINEFSQFGVSEDDFEQVEEHFTFATDKELQALSIIKGDDKITIDGLAKALKVEPKQAGEILNSLAKQKLIDTKVEKQQGVSVSVRTLTDSANGLLKTNDVTVLETRYRYTLRPDAPKTVTKSREFCTKVLGLKKLYSREDIDTLSARLGYNVWTQRGGYYHNPKTDITTPYCRHQWSQVLVKKK